MSTADKGALSTKPGAECYTLNLAHIIHEISELILRCGRTQQHTLSLRFRMKEVAMRSQAPQIGQRVLSGAGRLSETELADGPSRS